MKNISDIDKNFKIETKLDKTDIKFYNVKDNPFCLFGLMFDEMFRRMPEDIAEKVNEGVLSLHSNTSGGRIRFKTNSPYVAIHAVMPDKVYFPHAPQTSLSGFDIYVGNRYKKTFIPPIDMEGGYEAVCDFGESKIREITINFPLYNNVKDLYIGLSEDAVFEKMTPYKYDENVIFYGSSITQGGCVSRPGLAYVNLLSNMLDFDFVNLGFSGSALGEIVMADYIAEQNPDIFVMDYDHNAPTAEHLGETHEKFFKRFRELRPETPVVFISAPNIRFNNEYWEKRRQIVRKTYENAIENGDENVYFVDGKMLWGDEDWDLCAVDALHPNDLGHYRMAKYIEPILDKILNGDKT